MILGMVGGKTEDEVGKQFVGDAGQILRNKLKKLGYLLDKDFIKDNAVICRTMNEKGNNRNPTIREINCCRNHVFETIKQYNPKVIIPMGKIALQSLLGLRIKGVLSDVKYSDWVGEIIPDQELKKYICPIYHPSFIMRNERDIVLDRNWERDLKNAIETADKPFYGHNYESDVIIIKNEKEAIKMINDFISKNPKKRIFAFDYETTGKKPHRKGHKIISVSFSDGLFSYSFPFYYTNNFLSVWKKLLTDDNSYCVAQNALFEEMWTETILGFKAKNWLWDTMIAQSVINNRKNTKLKFWAYIDFGIISYNEKVDNFINKVKEGENPKSDNAFNRINEVNIDDLLLYNGLDGLFTFKRYESQINKIGSATKERFTGIINRKQITKASNYLYNGYDLFMEGFQRLLQAQQNGVRIDEELLLRNETKLKRKIKKIKEDIYSHKELKRWDKKEKFDFTKTNHLKHFLYNCVKVEVKNRTKKGMPSLDHSVLEKIDFPMVKDILEYRRWDKALSTYISQYKREVVKGFVHPFFHLGSRVKSFRSSSSRPNLQNQPKRDAEVKNIIRSFVIPREGNKLIEWDFKSMEVSGAASNNEDPVLIKYLKDDNSDMHRDWAAFLFMKNKNEIDRKKERFVAKNQFVFAEFYGSYYIDTAKGLWENMHDSTKEHLRKKGVIKYDDWEEHVRQVEEKLWETFHVYAEWKRKIYKDYEKKGYIELLTGFRCYGPMKYNEVINYMIQGPSFHILLWTFNNVMRIMEKRKYDKSFLIGQIHDSSLGDICPDDEKEIDYLFWKWGTQKVREKYPWIIVPLKIEKESSEINGNWATMFDRGFLKG
jgi:uracil-DNA glycosylase family 4